MSHKIAMIGKGNVGQALAEGLRKAGHEMRFASTDPREPSVAAAEWGDIVILAVPWATHRSIAEAVGNRVDKRGGCGREQHHDTVL